MVQIHANMVVRLIEKHIIVDMLIVIHIVCHYLVITKQIVVVNHVVTEPLMIGVVIATQDQIHVVMDAIHTMMIAIMDIIVVPMAVIHHIIKNKDW